VPEVSVSSTHPILSLQQILHIAIPPAEAEWEAFSTLGTTHHNHIDSKYHTAAFSEVQIGMVFSEVHDVIHNRGAITTSIRVLGN
jgi:hypothetical protein